MSLESLIPYIPYIIVWLYGMFSLVVGFLYGMRFTGHRWFCRVGWHRRGYSLGEDGYTDWCCHCGEVFRTGIKVIR